ncbi:hypothetical protein P9112_012287 [Eukaryota sp. TZLM1-RC]
MLQAFLELGKSTLSSIAATFFDGLVYSSLLFCGVPIYLAAFLGSVCGGILHFSLCYRLVFKPTVSKLYSLVSYFTVSYTSALLHGLLTMSLSKSDLFGPSLSWAISKIIIFCCFTFPLSRYVVFSGYATRIEAKFITLWSLLSRSRTVKSKEDPSVVNLKERSFSV